MQLIDVNHFEFGWDAVDALEVVFMFESHRFCEHLPTSELADLNTSPNKKNKNRKASIKIALCRGNTAKYIIFRN